MPVVIVPLAWRCIFDRDVTAELLSEMQLIERECGLSPAPASTLAGQLTSLLGALLSLRSALRRTGC